MKKILFLLLLLITTSTLRAQQVGNIDIPGMLDTTSPLYKTFTPLHGTNGVDVSSVVLNNNWTEVKKHKGQYYLYKPCNPNHNIQLYISDSSIKIKRNGIVENNIVNFISLNGEKEYQIFGSGKDEIPFYLNLNIIDTKSNIAKATLMYAGNQSTFYLVDNSKIKDLNIIINNCLNSKGSEFKSEE